MMTKMFRSQSAAFWAPVLVLMVMLLSHVNGADVYRKTVESTFTLADSQRMIVIGDNVTI